MDFCVLIKISKQKVSFWYQSGSSPFESLSIKDSNEFPLYFFVDGSDFIFGEYLAIDRFNSNDPNAFGNYFEIIKDPSNHFTIAGNKKPVKQLLYHGIEKVLNFFINQVLYKNDSLESYRQNFPIRFWFDSDIEDKEKSLIENLFNEAGYHNVERVDYYSCLFEVLVNNGVINNSNAVLILNGINNTLHLELFKSGSEDLCGSSKLDGQGADPSVRILSEMIIEDILAQESYLSVNKETEVAALLTYSSMRLENVTPIIKGDAILTDGKKHYFEVKQRVLNERLMYNSSDAIIYAAINDLISTYGVNDKNLSFLLNSKEINTPYMINKFLSKYPIVKGVDQKYVNDSLKLMFAKVAQSGYKVKKAIQNPFIESVVAPTQLPPRATAPTQLPPRPVAPIPPRATAPPQLPPRPAAPIPPRATAPPQLPPRPAAPIPPRATVPPQLPPRPAAPIAPKVMAPPPVPPRPVPPPPPKVTAPPPLPPRPAPPMPPKPPLPPNNK
jgi:hypothetical protein